uniref:Uncharacterized protein n=1 Tax=Rhizophora mucronata TaxID=61149 RepID=A0A2P2Q1R3_RHIMU
MDRVTGKISLSLSTETDFCSVWFGAQQ